MKMRILSAEGIVEVAVDEKMIVLFAKEYLKYNKTVNEYLLQMFMAGHPEVNKIIPTSEIREALDNAYVRGELEVVFADSEIGVYTKGKRNGRNQ
jgi:hypothetical protein